MIIIIFINLKVNIQFSNYEYKLLITIKVVNIIRKNTKITKIINFGK